MLLCAPEIVCFTLFLSTFVDTILLKPSRVVCYVIRVYMKYGYVYHGGPQSFSLLSDI